MTTILVLHGPNLPLKGLAAIDGALEARAGELGVELAIFQANGEAALLDELHRVHFEVEAVILNPGVLAPAAWALAEAVTLLKKPAVEVLLAPPQAERGPSALAGAVRAQVHDQGADGYLTALGLLVKELGVTPGEEGDEEDRPAPRARDLVRRPEKTIGRKVAEPAAAEAPRQGKSIGRRVEGAPAKPAAPAGLLTRALVREKLNARLKGTLAPDALAAWARAEWARLNAGGPCEEAARGTLDSVLLTVMGGAKATDAIVLAQLARLDS